MNAKLMEFLTKNWHNFDRVKKLEVATNIVVNSDLFQEREVKRNEANSPAGGAIAGTYHILDLLFG